MIELECGDEFTIDEFIEDVKTGCIIDYDGFGEPFNAKGENMGRLECYVPFLEELKKQGCVKVIWYNR